MLEHLASHRSSRYDCLLVLCRVCGWRGNTVQDVVEHGYSQHLRQEAVSSSRQVKFYLGQ